MKATAEEAIRFAAQFEVQPTTPVAYDSDIGRLMRKNMVAVMRPWRGWYFIIGDTEAGFAEKMQSGTATAKVYP